MSTPATHKIVVAGGNFGGVGAVHHLLQRTIPSLKRIDASTAYHITLVTPNTQFFFKIASPRALINPTLIPESKIVRPLKDAFAKYQSADLTLLHGVVSSTDAADQKLIVRLNGETGETQELHYDSLLIATGTTSESPLWTLHNDETLTWTALKSMHSILPSVKSVLIAGGGPVGVETAGEIAHAYPSCKVKLLSGRERLLHHLSQTTSARAQQHLERNLNVEVIHSLRIESVTPDQASSTYSKSEATQPTTVTLSDGTTQTVDLYISATGAKPNTSFLPQDWLDDSKRIIMRDAFFRVRGGQGDDSQVKNVYALGDVVSGSSNTSLELDEMIPSVCSSIAVDLAKRLSSSAAPQQSPTWLEALLDRVTGNKRAQLPKQIESKPWKDTGIIPVGPKLGTGQLNGYTLPSWFVVMAKSKTFLVPMVEPMLAGSKWK